MNTFQKTICILSLIACIGFVFPPDTFAQNSREDRQENMRKEREERTEERKGRVQNLRQRADELRTRFLNSTTTPEHERSSKIEVQEADNVGIDRKPLKEKIQEFKEAKKAIEENPQALENQKVLLLRAIDSLTEHAKLLEEKANRFPVINGDLKASIAAEIEADIAQLEEFRVEVQEATTQEKLRQIAQDLQEHRTNVTQTKIRKLMLLAHTDVFEYQILKLASHRASGIGERLNEFETNGKNVSQLEELLQDANELIAAAGEDLDRLEQDISANNIDSGFMQELQIDFHGIQQKIGDSYSIFRQIAQQAQEL